MSKLYGKGQSVRSLTGNRPAAVDVSYFRAIGLASLHLQPARMAAWFIPA